MALLCCAITLSVQPIYSVHASDSVGSDASTGNSADPNNNAEVNTIDNANSSNVAEVSTIDSANANNNAEAGPIDSVDADDIADSSDFFSEEYFYSDLPIVFSATRLAQTVSETPVSMTIIDREMIEASGATEIPDLMRLVPGMQVANYGGNEYFVTYHGRADLYSRGLQVLVDGRSIYNPVIGGVSWSDLPLAMEDIKRIEVIRGSNAAAYGSNSFSGVINIITEAPSDQHGTLVKTTISDKQTRQVLARNAGAIGDLDYRLTLQYDESEGLKSRYDDASNKFLSFRGDYTFDSNNQISFQAGYSSGTQQAGFAGSIWNIPRDSDNSSNFQQIKWTHTTDQDSEYSLHFFHNYKELDDTIVFAHPIFFAVSAGVSDLGTAGFSYESDRYELEFQHSLKPMEDLRLVWGVGLRHDSSKSPETLGQESAAIRNQVHAFANGEWKASKNMTVNFGAMLEKYEGFSGLFSPRVALNYSLNDGHTFRISSSRAYRMPNIWEEQINMKFFTIGGTPVDQLHKTVGVPDPEKIDSIELGYMAAFKSIPLTFDAKLFKERISPTINFADDASTDCPSCVFYNGASGNFNNDGKVEINGFELQLDLQATANTNIHAIYSHLNATGYQVNDYDNTGLPARYHDVSKIVPTKTYGILASHHFDNGINVSAGLHHTSMMTWLDPGNKTDAYNKWDFRIAKKFTLPDATIDVAAILHNITDDDYQEYYNGNQAQREFHLQVGVKF